MSVQIFLQGKIVGIEEFLLRSSGDFEGRAHWAALLSEVLPRALLAELSLSTILLGSSGGGQFLLLLPAEVREAAEDFCRTAAIDVYARSGGLVQLVWAVTENLGDWSDVRKRLQQEIQHRRDTPAGVLGSEVVGKMRQEDGSGDWTSLASLVRDPGEIAWSPERPASIEAEGKHRWALGTAEGIGYARHAALQNNDRGVASPATLGSRAAGRKKWAVLIGDVDLFQARLWRATTIEEHIQLSIMFKQFFAGELQMLCSQGDFFQRISLLYSSGQDFAVYGSWNACIGLAREVQRLFQQFIEANLKDAPGLEGKTISMGVAIAGESNAPLERVWAQARENLELAKASGKDGIFLFGRTLEWKQLSDAAETKTTMARMVKEFGCPPQFLHELSGLYRATANPGHPGARRRSDRLDKPWRFHHPMNELSGTTRNREFQRLRGELIADFAGRRASQVRLRPQGSVALEWAKLEIGA